LSDPVPTSTPDPLVYERYYGLAQSPFTLSPDPRFLYLSESHDEALRALLQALRRREGFIVLAGDIGTGKTTLCRALVEQLDRTTFTSLVLDPFVSVEELLREVLVDFGIASRDAARNGRLAAASRHELIGTLHDFLLSLVPLQGSCVLIIDEAQHLSTAVLEQIRVMANLETNQVKLLQIVLVGQLNLLDTLAAAEMRQLAQRVSVRARLRPLTRAEVAGYVAHRLSVANRSGTVAFDATALDALHRLSGGVPRVINLLCDRALALGAQRGATSIDASAVRDAAQMLEINTPGDTPDRIAPGASAAPARTDTGSSTNSVDTQSVDTRSVDSASIDAASLEAASIDTSAIDTTGIDAAIAEAPAGAGRGRRIVFGVGAALILLGTVAAALVSNVRVTPPPSPPAPRFTLRLPAPIEPLPVPEPPPAPVRRRPVPPPDAVPAPELPPL
jgi:type II secretory pathway predicted ATPase ExeA